MKYKLTIILINFLFLNLNAQYQVNNDLAFINEGNSNVSFYGDSISNFCKKNIEINTIVIDAGHGGKDPGAIGHNLLEKDLTLEYALALKKKINEEQPDVEVILTRKTDIFVKLPVRVKIANNCNADLFVSIHANSSENKKATGTETLIVKKKSKARLIAEEIEAQYVKNTELISRGVIIKKKYVLFKTKMPAVLTEIGFICNEKDGNYLNSSEGQKQIVLSIYNAIFGEDEIVEIKSYKIQLGAFVKKIDTTTDNWSLVKNLKEEKIGDFYKYYSTGYATEDDAKIEVKRLKTLGFTEFWIIPE